MPSYFLQWLGKLKCIYAALVMTSLPSTHTHTHTQTQKKWLQLLIPQRGYNHVKSSNTTYYINFFVYLYAIIYPVLPFYGQNPLLPLTVGHKSDLITVTVKLSYVN